MRKLARTRHRPGMRIRTIAVSALLACCLIGLSPLAGVATAGNLQVYYTLDEGTKDGMPPGGSWMEIDTTSDELTFSISAGQKIWFAAGNRVDEDSKKAFQMVFESPLGALALAGRDAFSSQDDDKAVPEKYLGYYDPIMNTWLWRSVFGPPQPIWERCAFTAVGNVSDVTWKVKAWSHCAVYPDEKPEPDWPKQLVMKNASFGASGVMIGDPHVTEIWVFPNSVDVDVDVSPVLMPPPASGHWTASFVYVDPLGVDRPHGGVRWVSDGVGLATEDFHDLNFAMETRADSLYEMFAFETQTGEYMDFGLYTYTPSLDIPTLSEWGLIILATLVLAALVWVAVNRRRRIAPA